MKYYKDITRLGFSLFDIKAWYKGESDELKKLINFGFYETIFVSINNNVTVYYHKDEADNFYEILDKILDENFFNEICDNYFELIDSEAETNEQIFELSVKIWPALAIFDVISKYPKYANDSMLRRLMRLRKSTESFAYDLVKKAKPENLSKDYIFFRGEIFYQGFDNFIKERGIEIITN